MINVGLADIVIRDFGFRKPTAAERTEFRQTLAAFGGAGVASGTRARDMAIFTHMINSRLDDDFKALYEGELDQKFISRKSDPIERISESLIALRDHLSEMVDSCQTGVPAYNDMIKTIKTGVRTGIMECALLSKTIAVRLRENGQLNKQNYEKFFDSGLSFIQEVSSLPQMMLHVVTNYLCGQVLNNELSSDFCLQPSQIFTEKRLEVDLLQGKLGVKNTFIDNLTQLFDHFIRRFDEHARNYKIAKDIPVFGCPAQYARVKLQIGEAERSVDFIEATYRVADRVIQANLFEQ